MVEFWPATTDTKRLCQLFWPHSDAYLESNGRQIDVYLNVASDQHITGPGSKQLSDATVSMRLSRGNVADLIGAVVWTNPGGEIAPFFRVQFVAEETKKAKPVVAYCWQLVLNWDDNNTNETTPIDSGEISFVSKISAS